MEIVWFLVIGVVAGWLAGQIMKGGGFGLVGDLILGIVGAVIGGYLLGVLGLVGTGLVGRLVTATIGAVVLIMALRVLRRSGV